MAVFLVAKCVKAALNDGMVSAKCIWRRKNKHFLYKISRKCKFNVVISSNFGKIAYSEKDNIKSRRNAV